MENRMTAQQLKNSILQMAVQGKLVDQDPNDEPALILLEKIKREKEQLIKEGKIKKNNKESYIFRGTDNLHYEQIGKDIKCIEDELPFEIPDSWEWISLSMVLDIARGGSPRPIKAYLTDDETGVNWIKIGDTEKGGKYINKVKEKIIQEGISKSRYVQKGDFLLKNSMSFGRPYILNVDGCIHDGWLVLRNIFKGFDKNYLYYLLSSKFAYYQFCKTVSGAVVKNLNSDKVGFSIFPLPPLEEQKRIVKKIEELEPLIEEYKKAEEQLYELNSNIKDRLKKSILQYAIEGKLVEQNPNDEPASVLLERIRNEKNKLIAEGKLKKDKNESVIFRRDNSYYEQIGKKVRCIDDEIPFELPDSWCWSKMRNCLDIRDGTHDTPKYISKGIPLVTSKNLKNGKIDFTTSKYISLEDHFKIALRSKVECGDILFAMIGSIGNPVLCNEKIEFSIKNMSLFKNISNGLDMEYVYLFLYLSQNTMRKYASGGVQSFVSLTYLRNYLIPIPPINEQQAIISKIKKINSIIDLLK